MPLRGNSDADWVMIWTSKSPFLAVLSCLMVVLFYGPTRNSFALHYSR